jgi:hypothetical protein
MPRKSKAGLENVVKELKLLQKSMASIQMEVRSQSNEAKSRPIDAIDLPPRFILKAAKRALTKTNFWSSAYNILSAYYGLPKLGAYINAAMVPKDAIACYYATSNSTYAKDKAMSDYTGLHEFAHHLCAKRLSIGGEAEQQFCDVFAEEVSKVWNEL